MIDPHGNPVESRAALVRLLRLAYSGELAAAYAYAGHWRSVPDPGERAEIRRIEGEELEHRAGNLAMLQALDERPSRWREAKMAAIGRAIGAFCRIGGWFLPMWGAGRLERRNIVEYEDAARLALLAGLPGMVEDLLRMAEVEWDHEAYFRRKAASHRFARILRIWSAPPERAAIRASFADFARAAGRAGSTSPDQNAAAPASATA